MFPWLPRRASERVLLLSSEMLWVMILGPLSVLSPCFFTPLSPCSYGSCPLLLEFMEGVIPLPISPRRLLAAMLLRY